MASGRKRKQGVQRYKDGSIVRAERGETEAQVMTTVMLQRIKIGANNDNWRAQEWESPLGRLRQAGKEDDCIGISREQFDAVKEYVRLRHANNIAMGYPSDRPKCIAGDFVGGGGGIAPDMDEEVVAKRRRAFNDARSRLLEYQGRGVVWCRLLDALARDEEIPLASVGEVRSAANVLANMWRLHTG